MVAKKYDSCCPVEGLEVKRLKQKTDWKSVSGSLEMKSAGEQRVVLGGEHYAGYFPKENWKESESSSM